MQAKERHVGRLPLLIGLMLAGTWGCAQSDKADVGLRDANAGVRADAKETSRVYTTPSETRREIPFGDLNNTFAMEQMSTRDEECCSDPGDIADCWWKDAQRDAVICVSDSDCAGSNTCDKTIDSGDLDPPNGWGLCTCADDSDCGDGKGICQDGVCGPSFCNGYEVCSCWGGCQEANTGSYADPNAMCTDVDSGYPGECCEGNYPRHADGSSIGFCSNSCDGTGGGGGPGGSDCVLDTDCVDLLPDPYSADCIQFLCDQGTCRLDYINENSDCGDNVKIDAAYAGEQLRDVGGGVLGCLIGRCDTIGKCLAEPAANDLPCTSDGLSCTDDLCEDGKCTNDPTAHVNQVCNPPTDNDACTVDRCDVDGECTFVENHNCDDSNRCTSPDTCVDSDAVHLLPSCTNTALNGSQGFVDSDCSELVCVAGFETTQAKTCVDAVENVPYGYDLACSTFQCVDGNGDGNCTPIFKNVSCSDGHACTTGDYCLNEVSHGTCTTTGTVDCNDANTCTDDSCPDDTCVNTAVEARVCDDGVPCSTASACNAAGSCVATAMLDCSSLNGECVTGQCNAGSGVCEAINKTNGTACTDNNPCTVSDTCTNGICYSGTLNDCAALETTCNKLKCNTANGTCDLYDNATKLNLACDTDGRSCTPETCQGANAASPLTCTMGTPACCETDEDCELELTLPCVDDVTAAHSDCYPPYCNGGTCDCRYEPTDTPCTDNDATHPSSCYDNKCNASNVCTSTVRAIAEVPNNLCSDLFSVATPTTFNTSNPAYLGELSAGAPAGTILETAGSTLCAVNNYSALAANNCKEAGTSDNLGGTGKDMTYGLRYQTGSPTDTTRYAYVVKVESDFDAAVYVQNNVSGATACPEGNLPGDDANEHCVTTTTSASALGSISYERWTGVGGTAVADIPVNNTPNATGTYTSFANLTDNSADNYGQRIRGYLQPSATATYYFWIAGDENVELWLSTDATAANKRRIAYHTTYSSKYDWDKVTTQASGNVVGGISLLAGQNYYIEALQKEGTGNDYIAVAWDTTSTKPAEDASKVIPGARLAPWDGGAGGPVTFSGVTKIVDWVTTKGSGTSGGTSMAFDKVSGTNRYLVVAITNEHGSAFSITQVQYGGTAGNSSTGVDADHIRGVDAQSNLAVDLWGFNEAKLTNAAITSNLIEFFYTGELSCRTMWAALFSNVDQANPFFAQNSATINTGSTVTANVAAAAGSEVMSFAANGDSTTVTWSTTSPAVSKIGATMDGCTSGGSTATAAESIFPSATASVNCSATFGTSKRAGIVSLAFNPASVAPPAVSTTTTCGLPVSWQCSYPYAAATPPSVMEEACASGNSVYSQNCCGTSTCTETNCYKWCRRGYRTSDNSTCDTCGSDCEAFWEFPDDPVTCDSLLPDDATYDTYTNMAVTVIKPDYTADGTWRNAVIYVDGSKGHEGNFYITVEKIPWNSSPCDRANDDIRVTDITTVASGGSTYPGTLQDNVNSTHSGSGTCGQYACTGNKTQDYWSTAWAGATACHDGSTANSLWPAKSYYTIYRTAAQGSQAYCVYTTKPSTNAADTVLTLESVAGAQQDICYENFTYGSCAHANYQTVNAKLEFTAVAGTQYKIGVSRYGGLNRPCLNSKGDGCDFNLKVKSGTCPAGCIALSDWYSGSVGGTAVEFPITETYTDASLGTIYRHLIVGSNTSGLSNGFDIGAGWDGNDQVWQLNFDEATPREVFFSGCQYGGSGSFNGMMALYDCQGNLVASNDDGCGSGGMAHFSTTLSAANAPYYLVADGKTFLDNGLYNIAVYYAPTCGDTQCNGVENCNTCPSDCGSCCGDGSCQSSYGETCNNCTADCGVCCGNHVCDPSYGETCNNCAADCGACCGNGTCNTSYGETCANCSTDCGTCCGNGSCQTAAPYSETCSNCTTDCGSCCGNGVCEASLGETCQNCADCRNGVCNGTTETCTTCPAECGACASCGDHVCNGTETCLSCSGDCGACCGNGSCQTAAPYNETCTNCASDCGSCCGNHVCDTATGETCNTCPGDCGNCCGQGGCQASYGETCTTCPTDCGTCAVCGGTGQCLKNTNCSGGTPWCDTSAVVYSGGVRVSGCGTCRAYFVTCNYGESSTQMDLNQDAAHGQVIHVPANGGCVNMDTTNTVDDWNNVWHTNRTVKMQDRYADSGTCTFPYTFYYATTYCVRIGTNDILDDADLAKDYVLANCSEYGTIRGTYTLSGWWADPKIPIRRYATKVDIQFAPKTGDTCVMNIQNWYDTDWGTVVPATITCPTSLGTGVTCSPNPPRKP